MGDLDCVKMLAKYGADLAAPSAEGFTALSAAFLNKELKLETIEPLVQYLLDNASFGKIEEIGLGWVTLNCSSSRFFFTDTALTDANGATPLHYAAAWASVSAKQILP